MGFEKCQPSGMPVSLRRGLDVMFAQKVGDGASANLKHRLGGGALGLSASQKTGSETSRVDALLGALL